MNKLHPGYYTEFQFLQSEYAEAGPKEYTQNVAAAIGKAFASILVTMSEKNESLQGIRAWIKRVDWSASDYDKYEMVILPGDDMKGTDPTGKHTIYADVTPGWWWVRYEGFEHRGDWMLVNVQGHVPLLNIYDYQDTINYRFNRPFPLRRPHPLGKEYDDLELWFYNKVDGPPGKA